MKISEIRLMPTNVNFGERLLVTDSAMRAGQILKKTKYYLREGVPPHIILELIDEMESAQEITIDLKP